MNVSTSEGNNTKYDAGLKRRRYVSGTGTAKVASTSRGKAETEEIADEE
jgi:hypothetical protein